MNAQKIFVKDFVGTEPYDIEVEDVYNYLNSDKKSLKTRYEFIDTKKNPFVKPYIDIDIKHRNKIDIDDNILISGITDKLKEIFDKDIEVVYKTNHRIIYYDKTNNKKKKSYHIIISNRKIHIKVLKKIMKNNMKNINSLIDKKYLKDKNGLDMSVYRIGSNSLRMPLSIKEKSIENCKKNKGFIMNLDNTLENFNKYLISKTEGLQEINIDRYNEEIKKEEEEQKELTEEEKECVFDKNIRYIFGNLKYNRYDKILEKYEVKKIIKDKKYPYTNLIKIDNIECPFNKHKGTNYRYIMLNYLTNDLIIKCMSDKCKDKKKVILEDVFLELREFNLSTFRKIEEYNYMKIYLEKRVMYMNDINQYKKICYDRYNNKHLQNIKFDGIGKSVHKYIGQDKEGNEVEKESPFRYKYETDKNAKTYSNTIFYPKEDYYNPNYYNEYEGLAYKNIIPFYEDKDKIYHKYQTHISKYIDFLLKYFCDNNKQILEYFLSLISFYIKYPYELNHIILVLYSNIQGTGKSSFLDFLTSIIGSTYSISCDIDKVINSHSNVAYKKILNIVEELEYSNKNNYAKILKNKCQEIQSVLNEKNEPMRKIDNFVHYILTTNDIKSLPLPVTDRRHFILEVKKIYDNDELINMIDNLYKDKYFIYSFGRYLKERTELFNFLSILNWEKRKPITNAFNLMVKRDTIDNFMMKLLTLKDISLDIFRDDEFNNIFEMKYDDILITPNDLFECYKTISKGRKSIIESKYIINREDSFIKQIVDIRKYFIKIKDENNKNYLKFDYNRTIKQLKIDNKYRRSLYNLIPILNSTDYRTECERINSIEDLRNMF